MFPDISDGQLVSATIVLKAREVQLAIASQLNTSRDPSVAQRFMRARVGFLKVPSGEFRRGGV